MTDANGVIKNLNAFVGDKMVRATALTVWSFLVSATPRDTGRAMASWRLKANKGDRSVEPAGASAYPPPQVPVPKPNLTNKDIYILSNNLPYIVPLNEGHSQQAGKFFIESAIARAIKEVGKQIG